MTDTTRLRHETPWTLMHARTYARTSLQNFHGAARIDSDVTAAVKQGRAAAARLAGGEEGREKARATGNEIGLLIWGEDKHLRG